MLVTEILGLVVASIGEIAKPLVAPLVKRVGYLVRCRKNIEQLRHEKDQLGQMTGSAKCATVEARRRGEVLSKDIETWLNKADRTVSEVQILLVPHIGEESINTCTNLGTRYKLGKRAANLLKEVNELKGQVGHISISRPALPPGIELMPTSDFEAFESTKAAMAKIIDALKHDDNKVVGVYGMGGVGKTSLIREVAKYTKTTNMFDEVVIATVSQNRDLVKIQTEIAEGLGLQLIEKTSNVRSLRLAQRLQQESRILIILDDVWEQLELTEIGIPCGKDKSNCKIAITTRSRDICNEMNCNVNVNIDVLSQQDSWSLFKKTANIVEPSDLKKVAKAVTKECGGLPLALVTLGKFLRDKDPRVWENAACELRKSRPLYIKGMHEKVFSCLKLSFDHTHNEDSKLCYLYCSLFPEDYDVQIEALLRYGFGEGLFSDAETIDEARNRVHSIISDLEASCLLLRSDKEEYVKMHDVFRDLAVSIATSNDYCFVVKASSGLKEWPAKSRLENAMRMSVVNNEFSKFPGRQEYPELLLLLLQNNVSVRAIPDDFFAGMGELRVLDLSNIPCLGNLTPSFASLTNLRTLCFENNILQDGKPLPLGNLKLLEILSLRESSFVSFPEEIKALTNLRLLDLTDAKVGTIPANMISSLCRLEELYLGGSYSKWEVKESETQGSATLGEVLSLEYLNTLIIDIAKYSCLTEEISGPCSRLKKFNVLIGERVRRQTAHGSRICFNISDKLGVPKPFNNWIKSFLQSTSELSIIKWKDLSSLEQLQPCDFRSVKHLHVQQCGLQAGLSASLFEKFKGLRDLEIFSCSKMETVFLFDDDDSQNNVLPELTTMHIQEAPRLSNVWRGATLSGCFQSLRDVKVESCGQIKCVFPSAVANGLNQLRLLEISNCESLEVVICGGENDIKDQEPVFPRLQTLKLRHLQSLRSLSLPQQNLDFPSLEFLTLLSCPRLKKLPFGPKGSERLIMIEAEKEWLEELEFENQKTRVALLKRFIDIRARSMQEA